jgi:hypothetical protein
MMVQFCTRYQTICFVDRPREQMRVAHFKLASIAEFRLPVRHQIIDLRGSNSVFPFDSIENRVKCLACGPCAI